MSDMDSQVKGKSTVFAASGLYLLAAVGLWLSWLFADDLSALLLSAFPGMTPETLMLVVSLIYYIPFMLLPVALLTWRNRSADLLRPAPMRFGTMMRVVIIAIAAVMIAQDASVFWYAIWQKLGLNVFVDNYVRPANSLELTLSVITAAVVAPVCEELLFRGVILPAWEPRSTKRAVMVTAVLFAILHGSLLGLPGQLFGGILLGLLVVWTGSIYAGLTFHSVYNAAGVILNYISSGIPMEAAEEALMETSIVAYMGGFPTLLLLALEIAMMLAIILMASRRIRLVYALRRMMARGEEFSVGQPLFVRGLLTDAPEPTDSSPLSSGTLTLIALGIVSSAGLYLLDIFSMLGG